MPLFSIVVPAYNTEKYIERTLESLINQSFRDYEIIVVDDGSSDNTGEIVKKYTPRVSYIKQVNQGPGPARNTGVKAASGKYIVSFDSDDLLFPFALEVYSRVIKYFNDPPFIFSKMHYFIKDEDVKIDSTFKTIECIKHLNFFKKKSTVGMSNSNMIIKRENLIKAGGYEPGRTIFDDRGLAFRLGTESPFIQVVGPATVGHRVHAGVSMNTDLLRMASLGIVKNERENSYPGGRVYKFDRRGLIGTNLLFLFKNYFGLKHLNDIIRIALKARFMLVQGILRNFSRRKYRTERYRILL